MESDMSLTEWLCAGLHLTFQADRKRRQQAAPK